MAEAALIVRKLPRDATANDVRKAFEPFCVVTNVEVEGTTGPGVAIVTIETAEPEFVRDEMNGATVGGRRITVKLASSKAPAQKPSTKQPRNDDSRAAAIELNKLLISSRTAADILSLFEDKGGDFDHVNFATSLHRLGVLGRSFEKSSRPLLHKLVDGTASSIVNESDLWKSRELSNACWGLVKIGNVEAPALFEAVAVEAPKKIATFNPQDLANTVWAYSTAGVEALALFEA
ncbi:hypothetical protein M885DRAFT_566853, partial [Pelagophyceae sp. CCMP2097]